MLVAMGESTTLASVEVLLLCMMLHLQNINVLNIACFDF